MDSDVVEILRGALAVARYQHGALAVARYQHEHARGNEHWQRVRMAIRELLHGNMSQYDGCFAEGTYEECFQACAAVLSIPGCPFPTGVWVELRRAFRAIDPTLYASEIVRTTTPDKVIRWRDGKLLRPAQQPPPTAIAKKIEIWATVSAPMKTPIVAAFEKTPIVAAFENAWASVWPLTRKDEVNASEALRLIDAMAKKAGVTFERRKHASGGANAFEAVLKLAMETLDADHVHEILLAIRRTWTAADLLCVVEPAKTPSPFPVASATPIGTDGWKHARG